MGYVQKVCNLVSNEFSGFKITSYLRLWNVTFLVILTSSVNHLSSGRQCWMFLFSHHSWSLFLNIFLLTNIIHHLYWSLPGQSTVSVWSKYPTFSDRLHLSRPRCWRWGSLQKLNTNSILIQLIPSEEFPAYSHHKNFKPYILHLLLVLTRSLNVQFQQI
jgi:hypothetical protein